MIMFKIFLCRLLNKYCENNDNMNNYVLGETVLYN